MPISMPASPGFVSSKFGLETNTGRFESPLSKVVQRILRPGARWTTVYTLPVMNRTQAAVWHAFLLSLEGGVNTFYGFDPDAKTPRGSFGGTPLVKGASQTGSSLNIDGCTPSITGWGKAGDYVGVNGQMVMLTADANTDGSGETTIYFKPALRSSPSDNAALTTSNVTCEMILADDNQSMWNTGKNLGIYEPISFAASESLS